MNFMSYKAAAALLMLSPVVEDEPNADHSAIDMPVERVDLENGLTIFVHEDHSIPVVHTEVWYKVGSQNEEAGLTGFAHLFEHLMFQGSENHNTEYFAPLSKVGASVNGTTNTDRTNYYERLPSEYLELAFWLEADRMGWLLPALTQEKLDNQRDVVKNERRQRYENVPYGLARMVINENMYPEGHPYRHLTIGSQEDLDNASLETVKDFFRTYYVPNNASLCVAGDVTVEEVKAAAEKYFGEIPRGEAPPAVTVPEAKLTEEVRLTIEDKVSLPRLYMSWHTPAFFASGDAELDILSSVLTGGLSSRLYQALVYEGQMAQDVQAYQASAELGSRYMIVATAAPGHTLKELEQAINQELNRIQKSGPTEEEVQRAINGWESRFVLGLQNIGTKAGMLCRYHYLTGDANYLKKDLERYLNVTPESVRKTAEIYLKSKEKLVLSVVPVGQSGQ